MSGFCDIENNIMPAAISWIQKEQPEGVKTIQVW
jgi:hypothetical protein